MECTYLAKGEPRRCLAFRGLMLPSSGEVKEFCSGNFHDCPIYRHFETTGEKITRKKYVLMQKRTMSA